MRLHKNAAAVSRPIIERFKKLCFKKSIRHSADDAVQPSTMIMISPVNDFGLFSKFKKLFEALNVFVITFSESLSRRKE